MNKKRIMTAFLSLSLFVTACFGGMNVSAEQTPFKVYLSPSSQFANYYINGGNEEIYMRQVAEAMIPYLQSYGIDYVLAKEKRAVPQADWGKLLPLRAQEAAATNCDLYLAIHSNARSRTGTADHGADVYYYTPKPQSKRWAEITRDNYIYPDKSLIKLAVNDKLIDMYTPTMTSILIETAYHDNLNDANWIKVNIDKMAKSLAYSIAQYRFELYGIPINESPAVEVKEEPEKMITPWGGIIWG